MSSIHNPFAGAPIVSEKWVDGSGRSGAFLEARDHLLQDAAAEAKFGFNLAHAWEAAQQALLLDNTAVFLTPGTHGSVTLTGTTFIPHAPVCCTLAASQADKLQPKKVFMVAVHRINSFKRTCCASWLTLNHMQCDRVRVPCRSHCCGG